MRCGRAPVHSCARRRSGPVLHPAAGPVLRLQWSSLCTLRLPQALLCLKAGKHVLVEKPAALCAADWEEMTRCAAQDKVFLMEVRRVFTAPRHSALRLHCCLASLVTCALFYPQAMWTRFFPAVRFAQEAIARGDIGEVVGCTVQFGFKDEVRGEERARHLPSLRSSTVAAMRMCAAVVIPAGEHTEAQAEGAGRRSAPRRRLLLPARGANSPSPSCLLRPLCFALLSSVNGVQILASVCALFLQAALALGTAVPSSVAPTACVPENAVCMRRSGQRQRSPWAAFLRVDGLREI